MEKKNPLLAGLINFFIWGGGYLYIGKKQTLGFGLIFVAILEHSPLLILGLGIVTTYARARNQKFAVNLVMGLFAWLFGVTVFMPTASVYAAEWGRLIALFLVVDIGYYLLKALKNSGPLFDYFLNRVTSIYMDSRKIEDDNRAEVWRGVKKVIGVVVMLVVYLMMYPLLSAISIILPGIAFILILIQMLIYVLFPITGITF